MKKYLVGRGGHKCPAGNTSLLDQESECFRIDINHALPDEVFVDCPIQGCEIKCRDGCLKEIAEDSNDTADRLVLIVPLQRCTRDGTTRQKRIEVKCEVQEFDGSAPRPGAESKRLLLCSSGVLG